MKTIAGLKVQPIDSFEGPDLQPYRTMKRDGEHRKKRIFVAEGDKVVVRMLESEFEVTSLLMPEKWVMELAPLIQARPEDIKIYTAERKLLEEMSGFSMYQGVLGVGRVPESIPLLSLLKSRPQPYLFAAVEDLTNAENLGGLVRNCAAFGVTALLVGESCSSPYLRRAIRASMGTIFKLPVVETQNLAHTMLELRQEGVHILAAHPHTKKNLLGESKMDMDCCLLFGSEGFGISETLVDLCDKAIAVPMANEVDSLNVGSAAAVFLYEAARQQGRLIPGP